MKTALFAMALAVALLSGPLSVDANAQTGGGINIPLSASNTTQTFTGNLNIYQFANQGGQVVALGKVTGTLTNLVNNTVTSIVRFVTLPLLPGTQATCQILHLELGPLDLDLLGLMIHLNKVVLDISAQQGPGNLLGNLLCAIANLLNNGGGLQPLVELLNQLLRAL